MQYSRLIRATLQVANTTGVSGRVTDKSFKKSELRRIGALAIFGLAIWLIPVTARAQAVGLSELQAQVAALQSQVAAQQAQIATLQSQVTALQANPVLGLATYVTIDTSPQDSVGVKGPNITFKGANIHIVDGLNTGTDDNGGALSGLGNLIIGYDEAPAPPFNTGDRGGSHNLVIGRFNKFTSSAFGGLVAGEQNTIGAQATSVSGGALNTASGLFASVSGGEGNTASGELASVSGGLGNTASVLQASVSGGGTNTASVQGSSVSGGLGNTASNFFANVSGGQSNKATGQFANVSGGENNTANGNFSSILGGNSIPVSTTDGHST
jgi:hypothetical protein